MARLIKTTLVVSAALALAACGVAQDATGHIETIQDNSNDDRTAPSEALQPDLNTYEAPLMLGDGVLAGDYGGVAFPTETVADVSGYADWGFAQIEVLAVNGDGAGMVLLDFFEDPRSLSPGTVMTYSWDEWDAIVMAVGCAGAEPGDWAYDDLAAEVTVSVEQKRPGLNVIHFVASFSDDYGYGWGEYDGTYSGSFELTVP